MRSFGLGSICLSLALCNSIPVFAADYGRSGYGQSNDQVVNHFDQRSAAPLPISKFYLRASVGFSYAQGGFVDNNIIVDVDTGERFVSEGADFFFGPGLVGSIELGMNLGQLSENTHWRLGIEIGGMKTSLDEATESNDLVYVDPEFELQSTHIILNGYLEHKYAGGDAVYLGLGVGAGSYESDGFTVANTAGGRNQRIEAFDETVPIGRISAGYYAPTSYGIDLGFEARYTYAFGLDVQSSSDGVGPSDFGYGQADLLFTTMKQF